MYRSTLGSRVIKKKKKTLVASHVANLFFFFFFITLGLELSDTKVYEP